MYHNEETVGQGIKEAMEEYGIAREDIFVITKCGWRLFVLRYQVFYYALKEP